LLQQFFSNIMLNSHEMTMLHAQRRDLQIPILKSDFTEIRNQRSNPQPFTLKMSIITMNKIYILLVCVDGWWHQAQISTTKLWSQHSLCSEKLKTEVRTLFQGIWARMCLDIALIEVKNSAGDLDIIFSYFCLCNIGIIFI